MSPLASLCLLCALLVPLAAGCRRPPPDGSAPPAEPSVFGAGTFSTGAEEYRITFTPDGKTAYFARGAQFFPLSRQATIMVSHRAGDTWSTPVVATFSGTYPDIDPFVTPDGQRLFFSSIRPVGGQARRDLDLWMLERRPDGQWGDPIHLGAAVNSESDELYPSVAADGTLLFGSDRPGGLGGWDIYHASRSPDGTYTAASNVGAPINSVHWEFNPAIAADGQTLVFTSLNRPGGRGLGDLYQSRRVSGAWEEPRPLEAQVNTPDDEFHPSLSPDGLILYFVRRAARSQGDLWWTTWR